MAINKVTYFGNTLIDLSNDSLTSPTQLAKGVTAHTKDGSIITGTLEASSSGSGAKVEWLEYIPASDVEIKKSSTYSIGLKPTITNPTVMAMFRGTSESSLDDYEPIIYFGMNNSRAKGYAFANKSGTSDARYMYSSGTSGKFNDTSGSGLYISNGTLGISNKDSRSVELHAGVKYIIMLMEE